MIATVEKAVVACSSSVLRIENKQNFQKPQSKYEQQKNHWKDFTNSNKLWKHFLVPQWTSTKMVKKRHKLVQKQRVKKFIFSDKYNNMKQFQKYKKEFPNNK